MPHNTSKIIIELGIHLTVSSCKRHAPNLNMSTGVSYTPLVLVAVASTETPVQLNMTAGVFSNPK